MRHPSGQYSQSLHFLRVGQFFPQFIMREELYDDRLILGRGIAEDATYPADLEDDAGVIQALDGYGPFGISAGFREAAPARYVGSCIGSRLSE